MTPESIVGTIVTAVVGYLFWAFKMMQTQINNTLSKDETRLVIDDKLGPVKVDVKNLKDTMDKIDHKLDILLDRTRKSNDD